MNKTFLLIWIILQFALLLVGWGWVFVDRKNVKRKKAAGRQYKESGSADGSFDEIDFQEENPQKRPSDRKAMYWPVPM